MIQQPRICFHAGFRKKQSPFLDDILPSIALNSKTTGKLIILQWTLAVPVLQGYAKSGNLKKRMRAYDAAKQNIGGILSSSHRKEQNKFL